MKRVALLLVLLCAATALGQQRGQQRVPAPLASATTNITEREEAPTYSDLYCAGFITKQEIGRGNYVIGGLYTPNQTQFAQGDIVYLEGTGYQEGARYSVVRAVVDPDRMPMFPGQRTAIAEVGQPYADLGRVRVIALRGATAIAEVEFSCNAMVAGDLLLPFQEKPPLSYRSKTTFERFPVEKGAVSGRIVLAKDFDTVGGFGHKFYINVGADKGVKVGDYFRVIASYDPAKMDQTEALSYKMPYSEEAQKNVPRVPKSRFAELPRRAIAEAIVVNVTPTASTAMITLSLEHVTVGDTVELEPPVTVQQPPPQALQQPLQQPPTLSSCNANPSTVQSGQPSIITASGQSPDGRPVTYDFTASGGRLRRTGTQTTLETAGMPGGLVTITCTATDDRGLNASAHTTVNVEAPPPPAQASQVGSIGFSRDKRRPARVDNEAKAILDDYALRLQRDPGVRGVIIGNADANEKNAPSLAQQRAANARDYLVREKGIDPARLEVRTGNAGTQTVELWAVPSGAAF